jgi:hypothetical protein
MYCLFNIIVLHLQLVVELVVEAAAGATVAAALSDKRTIAHIITTNPYLSFLSSFSGFVQSTHINVRNIYIHAYSIN